MPNPRPRYLNLLEIRMPVPAFVSIVHRVTGAALFLLLPLLVYPAGMGMGDVKLAAFLGAALGRDVLDAFVVAFFAVAAVAVVILVREGSTARKRAIAFGPFLAAGGIAALFFGESIVQGLL